MNDVQINLASVDISKTYLVLEMLWLGNIYKFIENSYRKKTAALMR